MIDDVPPATVPVHRLRVGQTEHVDRTPVRRLEFVPVGEDAEPVRRRTRKTATPDDANAAPPQPPRPSSPTEPAWNLWGDLEP